MQLYCLNANQIRIRFSSKQATDKPQFAADHFDRNNCVRREVRSILSQCCVCLAQHQVHFFCICQHFDHRRKVDDLSNASRQRWATIVEERQRINEYFLIMGRGASDCLRLRLANECRSASAKTPVDILIYTLTGCQTFGRLI